MASNQNRRGLHKNKAASVLNKSAAKAIYTGSEALVGHLKASLPESLAKDLVAQFIAIRHDVVTGTLDRSSPGKFVETVVQALQQLERASFDDQPKVDNYLKNLESRQANLPDDLRLVVARVARAMYTLRSKRGIVHKATIDSNIYDLRYLYASAQWVLSETVRHASGSNLDAANQLVEFVQAPADIIVEDFGERRLVLTNGTARDELLLLLRHYYPQVVLISQIHKDMNRRSPSTVSNAIRAAWTQKHIEGEKSKGYKLTQAGYQVATALLKIAWESLPPSVS